MAKCPWCGTTIAKFFLDRKCPKCGEQLGDSKSISNATLATIEGDSPQDAIDNFEGKPKSKSDTIGTVDIEQAPPPAPSLEKDSEATVDIENYDPRTFSHTDGNSNKLSKVATVTGDQTVDLDGTIDLEGTVDVEGTVDSTNMPQHDSAATVDAGSLPKAESDMTLDAPAPPPGSGTNASGSGQTMPASMGSVASSSLYKTAEVQQIWERAAGSSADPAHTLNKGPVHVTDSVFERISVRNLNLNPNVVADEADYHIRTELGRGKQGVVYAAKQKGLGRTVAIKLVMKGAAGSVEREKLSRFVREAEITAALDHPNILPIHELAVTSGGELFYSMKKVEGNAWNDIIDENTKTLEQNVDYLLKVCDALAFAHSKKVIHRDLKPGNIMIGDFGEVLVADWGMAVDLSKTENFKPSPQQKDPFSFGGTPAYMSPEMAKHDWPRIGPRSDIYLLGAILYHLVEGRPPRDGRTVYEVLERARSNFYFPVKEESGLIAVALKAMATSPLDRYATVEELSDAIREVNKHAESARLSEESDALLLDAQKSSDYGKFNEAIFGFRNAIRLWEDNKPAKAGLKRARLAYSENALSRGDFDVCLETLDPTENDEKELYKKAKAAQEEARSREVRYRRLRRVSAVGAVGALTILSGLSLWLWFSIAQVRLAEGKAIDERNNALEQEKNAKLNAQIATFNEEVATFNAEAAALNETLAVMARDRANENASKLAMSIEDLRNETQAKETQRKLAEQNAIEALLSERIAKLGGYQSSLLSAYNLAQSYNVRRSNALLAEIQGLQAGMLIGADKSADANAVQPASSDVRLQQAPPLISWPYRRVAALIGRDIPQFDWGRKASCIDVATNAPFAVLGSAEGKDSLLQIVKIENDRIEPVNDLKLPFERSIVSVAISPDGKEVIFITAGSDKAEPGVFNWDIATKQVSPIAFLKNREFRWSAFSPDGKHFLVGINGGIYRWPRTDKLDLNNVKPFLYKCRGLLRNIQFLETDNGIQRAICTAIQSVDTKGTTSLACYELDLNSEVLTTLQIPDELSSQATVATVIDANGRICLGTVEGRLLLLDRGKQEGGQIEFNFVGELTPRVHQTKILHIRPYGNDAMITIAEDNAIQLWRKSVGTQATTDGANEANVASSWTYERPLVGLPSLAVDGRYYKNGEHVVALDQSGICIDWDLKKIAARQRMDAPESASGIVAAGGQGDSGKNWWIDQEGVLRVWGTGVGPQEAGLQFPGHTPKAEFVDLVTSTESDRTVSVARLTEKSTPFRNTSETMLEFCVWETSSGKMLHRWTRISDNSARVALVANGKRLVWVNSLMSSICDLDGSNEKILKMGDRNINAVEIVAHPIQSNLLTLVGDKADTYIVDLAANDTVVAYNAELAEQVAYALTLKAQWNRAGNRLYILRTGSESGVRALASLGWQSGTFKAGPEFTDPLKGLNFPGTQAFKHGADLNVDTGPNGQDVVHCAARYPLKDSNEKGAETWVAKVVFDEAGKGQVEVNTFPVKVWLTPDSKPMALDDISLKFGTIRRSFSKVIFDNQNQVIAAMDFRNKNFMAAIANLNDPKASLRLYGRTGCVAASGDSTGDNWLTLHDEGELWSASRDTDGTIQWLPIPNTALKSQGFTKIDGLVLAPSGKKFTVTGQVNDVRKVALVDLTTNGIVKSWDGYSVVSWHPSGEQLALGTVDGNIKIVSLGNGNEQDGKIAIDAVSVTEPALNRLAWFRENLTIRQQGVEARWYVVAQIGDRNLQFYSIESAADAPNFAPIALDAKISAIACSSVDNTIAVGTSFGNISTWFASPSVDKQPRELFSIDAHRGSIVSDISFSKDGYTLFSADAPEATTFSVSRGRVFGWVSIPLPEENVQPLARN
jgi:serine/threonine protein kinase/WD40 repeat protein